MSLLTEFVSVLLPIERKKLSEIPLKGKQAAIMQAVLENPFDETHVQAKATALGMSPSHLYATQSILLERAYEAVVVGGGIDLLVLLSVRGLDLHAKKALHSIERTLRLRNPPKQELHDFYAKLMYLMVTGASIRFDHRKYASVVAFYERTRLTTHHDDGLCHEVLELCGKLLETIIISPHNREPKASTDLLQQLDELRARLEGSTHPDALFYLYYGYVTYFATIERDVEKLEHWSMQLVEILDTLAEWLAREERKKLELRRAAVSFMRSDYRQAFERYQRQHCEYGDALFIQYTFHLGRYLRTSLCLREFETATQLIEIGFPFNPDMPSTLIGAARGFYETILYLLQSKIEPARVTLQRSQRQNSGDCYDFTLDLTLRFLEVLLELLNDSSDDYTEKLIVRSLKHMSRKGMTLKTKEDELIGFHALKEVVNGNLESQLVAELLNTRLAMQPALALVVSDAINATARRHGRAVAESKR